jgi:hypothetical protein
LTINGQVAQSVEQGTENPRVGSSILSLATIFLIFINTYIRLNYWHYLLVLKRYSSVHFPCLIGSIVLTNSIIKPIITLKHLYIYHRMEDIQSPNNLRSTL